MPLNEYAAQCTARSKRTGEPCNNPAIRGKDKCRMHGGKTPVKHGLTSKYPSENIMVLATNLIALDRADNEVRREALRAVAWARRTLREKGGELMPGTVRLLEALAAIEGA